MRGKIDPCEDIFVASGSYIQAGDDLNDYLTVGRYMCTSAATATQVANMPEGGAAGQLIVCNALNKARQIIPGKTVWLYFVQWYISMAGIIYSRTISSEADGNPRYGKWKKFVAEVVQ